MRASATGVEAVGTNNGIGELNRLDVVLAEAQETVLAPLTDDERAVLVRLLGKLSRPVP